MNRRSVNGPYLEGCPILVNMYAIFGEMCHFWMNVPFLDNCVIFRELCHFMINVSFLEKCAIFGEMCHLLINVSFLEKCAIFE